MLTRHAFTDDFLNRTVARKLEAGASADQIERIISEFVSGSGAHGRLPIDRDLCIRDIPYDRRAEFFAALNLLAV